MKVLFYLAAIFLSALGVSADPIFAGCGNLGLLGNVVTGLLGTVSEAINTLLSGDQCNARCAELGYNYALFSQGLSLDFTTYNPGSLLGSCWCNMNGLQPQSVDEGTDNAGTCSTTLLGLIGVKSNYVATNSLTFTNCYSTVTFTPNTDLVQFTTSSVGACLSSSQCASKANIAVRAIDVHQAPTIINIVVSNSGGSYECSCSNGAISGASDNCGDTTSTTPVQSCIGPICVTNYNSLNYAYQTYSQVVVTNGRRRDLLAAQYALTGSIYCPRGYTACRLDSAADEYECLDTASDLESCGGCLYGEFGAAAANQTIGTDCTTESYVVPGHVECASGKCVASKCKTGRKLVNGACW